jgi:hypothetical protein
MTPYDAAAVHATIDAIQLALPLAATALLAWGALAERRGDAGRRVRDGLLIALATLSTAAWWNFGQLHFGGPDRPLPHVHDWDTYHYYAGAKYFDELAYDGLYQCTAAADLESSRWQSVTRRTLRNLETNALERVSPLAAAACKEQFSDARWEEFQVDIGWFRARIPNWDDVFLDWGFNATPVWIAAGRALASTGPASSDQIRWLTLLDVPLLALGFGSLAWGFGWRTLCIVLVFWGTNLPAEYSWTGGALLRHGWFALLLGGVSLLRRGHDFAAGLTLSTATLLRVFPGVVFAGLAVLGLLRILRRSERDGLRRTLRTAAGALCAIAVLVPLAAPSTGGLATWAEFARNSFVDTVPSANNIGLKGLLAHRERDKWAVVKGLPSSVQRWETARAEALADRWLLRGLGMLAGCGLLALAVLRRPREDWVAAVLGIGIVPIAFHLASYYHVSIAMLGLLAARRPWIGVALCALAAYSQGLDHLAIESDERYVWLTVGWLVFVVFAAYSWLAGERTTSTEPAREPVASASG